MKFTLSTNYLSERIKHGEALVEKVLSLGFSGIEAGYLLSEEAVAGIVRSRDTVDFSVSSVHAFSPIPFGAPYGYPELYALASTDEDEQAMAIIHLSKTLETAVRLNAPKVVYHAGRISFRRFGFRYRSRLNELMPGHDSYEKTLRLERGIRSKSSLKYIDALSRGLEKLLPRFEKEHVVLCLENLPSFEAIPNAEEFVLLHSRFQPLHYWHDIGHATVRGNYRWDDPIETGKRLLPFTGGIHIHDVCGLDEDHCAPGKGMVDFEAYRFYADDSAIAKVFEPKTSVSESELKVSLDFLSELWSIT